jgi:malonyl-CoA O-methyltransferase
MRRNRNGPSRTSCVTEPVALDKRQMRSAFSRAAGTYDGAAHLQRDIADQLLERLRESNTAPQALLDLGCGTGYLSQRLAREFPAARVVALDLAEGMLRRAHARIPAWRRWLPGARPVWQPLCADAESLPLADSSFDVVISNLALQWCDPERVFSQVRRVLRTDGLFLFSTFGPDTLRELRAAWQAADRAVHVHDFRDMQDLGDLLYRLGCGDPVMDVERHVLHHAGVIDALRDLKRIGAHNVARARARGLTGKQHFARFRAAYEAMAETGRIPVTYEVIYGRARATATRRRDPATIPVSEIGRRR